jgi:hypothetical protein
LRQDLVLYHRLSILLPQPPNCWDYRHVPPHPAVWILLWFRSFTCCGCSSGYLPSICEILSTITNIVKKKKRFIYRVLFSDGEGYFYFHFHYVLFCVWWSEHFAFQNLEFSLRSYLAFILVWVHFMGQAVVVPFLSHVYDVFHFKITLQIYRVMSVTFSL